MTTQPPRIAAWLLRLFGSSKNNEALLGDLQERYEHDLSSIWYWRQTVAIIFTVILSRTRATRRTAMKYAVWAIAFVGVFLVGFWAGRIPLRPVPVASVTWEADPVIT